MPTRPQHCSYTPQPGQYGTNAQQPIPPDMSPPLPKEEIKHIQRTIGSILYYAHTVDPTILTKNTMQKTKQLLDYPVTCTEATV